MPITLFGSVLLIFCAACSGPTGSEPDEGALGDIRTHDSTHADSGTLSDLSASDTGSPDVGSDMPVARLPCDPSPCSEPFRTVCTPLGTTAQCDCDPGYEPDTMSAACVPEPCVENTVRTNACGPFALGTQEETCLSEEWVAQDCDDPTVVEMLADIAPGTDWSVFWNDSLWFPAGHVRWDPTGPRTVSSGTTAVQVAGDTLFAAFSPLSGFELYSTDGTPSGTGLLYDLEPGPEDGLPPRPTLHRVGNRAMFVAQGQSPGVWSSDGTAGATTHLRTGDPLGSLSVGSAHAFFEQVELNALNQVVARHIWATDGTVGGTALVMSNGASQRMGGKMKPLNASTTVFHLNPAAVLTDVVCSDGTPAGTSSMGTFRSADLGAAAGNLYFFGGANPTAPDDVEILVSDCAGSLDVIDLNPLGSSTPRYFTPISDDMVAFVAQDDVGWALWSVDSTMAPRRLLDLGTAGARIGEYATIGSTLVFNYYSGNPVLAKLASTDGTVAGTIELMPEGTVSPDPFISYAEYPLFVVGDRAFFKAFREIWVTDGTAAGTRLLHSGVSRWEGVFADRFLFTTTDSTTSACALWAASPDAVVRVEAFEGAESCPIFARFGPDYALFTQQDTVFGQEPWVLRLR